MEYQQALDYLYSFVSRQYTGQHRPEQNLDRTRDLLAAFGEPQRAFPCVIVAGTKGKGSTSAMIESITRAAGLRTGLWTSPHLHTYRERIQVDRRLIDRADLVRLLEQVRPAVEAMRDEPNGPPVTFAIGFAIALRYFAEQQVDLAVLEVGLGGRFDSAAVVTPLVAAITSISYDHMAILGDTLAEIAWQKAGIIKPGRPVVSAPQAPEALEAIRHVAAEQGAPLHVVAPMDDNYPVPQLRGAFQRENAAVAAEVARLLRQAGLPINEAAIRHGIATTTWPARMELVPGRPAVLIDGAHNGDSIRRLLESIRAEFPNQRLILVFGSSRDKDLDRMLPQLIPAVSAIVLTRSQHPRAQADLDELLTRIRPLLAHPDIPLHSTPDVPEAVQQAQALAAPDDLILVTGSLFVAAAARETLGLAHEQD
jgi:dihydrofolate synthase/folylpolyglutamate synthase